MRTYDDEMIALACMVRFPFVTHQEQWRNIVRFIAEELDVPYEVENHRLAEAPDA